MDVDAMLADLTKQMDHTFLDLPELVSDDEGPPGPRSNQHRGWCSNPQQPQLPTPHHYQQQQQGQPSLPPDALQHHSQQVQQQHHHHYHHQCHHHQPPSQQQHQYQPWHLQHQQELMQYQDDSLSLLQPHLLHLLGPQLANPHLQPCPQPGASPQGGAAAQQQQHSSPSTIPPGSAGATDAMDAEQGEQ